MKHNIKVLSILTSYIFAAIVIVSCIHNVSADGFYITDTERNTKYEITYYGDEVTIKYNTETITLPFYTQLMDCSVYDGIVTLYSYKSSTDNKFYYCIYFYDTNDGSYTSLKTPYRVSAEEYVCATDKYMNVYMRDYVDVTLVYEYNSQNITYEYKTNTPVLQMLCAGGTDIYLITSDGVYCIKNHSINKIGDYILSIPCSLSLDTITDYNGNIYEISDGSITPAVTETETITTTHGVSDYEDIQVYSDCIVLDSGFTYAQLYRNLGLEKSQLTIYKKDGNILSSGKLGTGMKAEYNGQEYTINIKGDITGEGSVNSRDLKLMMKVLSGEQILNEDAFLSADLNSDGILNTKDLLKISQMY